jgi:hypothetical protein
LKFDSNHILKSLVVLGIGALSKNDQALKESAANKIAAKLVSEKCSYNYLTQKMLRFFNVPFSEMANIVHSYKKKIDTSHFSCILSAGIH